MTPESLVRNHIKENQTNVVKFLFENIIDIGEAVSNPFISVESQLLEMSSEQLREVIDDAFEQGFIDEDDYTGLKSDPQSIEDLVEFIFDYQLEDEFGLKEELKEDFYEWILVDNWLANQLEKRGESILSLFGSKWWGRDGYGQMYELDEVIKEIAKCFP